MNLTQVGKRVGSNKAKIQNFKLMDIFFFHLFQTETADMAPETRSSIKNLVQTYMSNPNAIILCIQGNIESICMLYLE